MSYFLYGGGGASYYPFLLDGGNRDDLTPDSIFNLWLPQNLRASFVPWVTAYSHWTAAFGIRNIAYEGGWSLEHTGHSDAAKDIAGNSDSRGVRALMDAVNSWTSAGGDLYMYYQSSGGPVFNLTTDITQLNTDRIQAIDLLNRSQRSPLTIGTPVPASIAAGQFDANDAYNSPWDGALPFTSQSAGHWYSYSIRAGTTQRYQVSLVYSAPDTPSGIEVFVDGRTTGVTPLPVTTSAFQETAKFAVDLAAGLHSVRIKYASGSFTLQSVNVLQ